MSAINEIERLFDTLELKQQLLVIERLARRMRMNQGDRAQLAREMQEMAADPDLQAALVDPGYPKPTNKQTA